MSLGKPRRFDRGVSSDVEDSIQVSEPSKDPPEQFRLRSNHAVSDQSMIGKRAQILDHNHPSSRNPLIQSLSNIQLSFYAGGIWITDGTIDLVTLYPFIAASSLRINSNDRIASN